MKYSPEIIGEIARRLAGRYVPTDVRNILESLESTDEQKALREDAERYRYLLGNFGIALPDDEGTLIWLPLEIDDAIDKARHDTPQHNQHR